MDRATRKRSGETPLSADNHLYFCTFTDEVSHPLLRPIRRHPRETLLVRLMHLRHLHSILPQLLHQLRRIEFTIAPPCLDHLALLVEREVLPCKARPDMLLEQLQDFVVADGAGIGEVVDSRLVVRSEDDRGGEEVVEDGVRVGDVDNTGVRSDLGNEGTGMEIIRDGHAEAEDECVRVVFEKLFGL